jgi:hypothetical protein
MRAKILSIVVPVIFLTSWSVADEPSPQASKPTSTALGNAENSLLPPRAPDPALRKLEKILPEVKFEGQSFQDVIRFFSDVTETNFFVNWGALGDVGLKADAPINLSLKNVKVSTALGLVLRQVTAGKLRLVYRCDQGIVQISTQADFDRDVTVRVYDVRDLFATARPTQKKRDEEPAERPAGASEPSGAIDASVQQNQAAPSGGGGLFSGGATVRSGGIASSEESAESLTKLIEQTIDPTRWRNAGGSVGSIQVFSGRLVVVTTPENQSQILELLSALRLSEKR